LQTVKVGKLCNYEGKKEREDLTPSSYPLLTCMHTVLVSGVRRQAKRKWGADSQKTQEG